MSYENLERSSGAWFSVVEFLIKASGGIKFVDRNNSAGIKLLF